MQFFITIKSLLVLLLIAMALAGVQGQDYT